MPNFFQEKEEVIITLEDKTEVDDEYFEFLSNGTKLFVFKKKDFETTDSIHHLASFLQECLKHQPQLHIKLMTCLQEQITSERAATLLELMAKVMDSAIPLTSKEGDAEWFKGMRGKFAVIQCMCFVCHSFKIQPQVKRELTVKHHKVNYCSHENLTSSLAGSFIIVLGFEGFPRKASNYIFIYISQGWTLGLRRRKL